MKKIKMKIRKWLEISDLYRRIAELEKLYSDLKKIYAEKGLFK